MHGDDHDHDGDGGGDGDDLEEKKTSAKLVSSSSWCFLKTMVIAVTFETPCLFEN